MGVAGRDYMRDSAGSRGRWVPGRLTWTLIAINAALWVVFTAAASWGVQGPARSVVPADGLGGWIYRHLLLHADEVFADGKIWQLFTSFWFHDWTDVMHVLWNMVFLYFFGRMCDDQLGDRGYLKLYLGGGLVASLIYTGYTFATGMYIPALGASGAVYAVVVWAACMHPRRIIHLFFVFPVPLWLLVGGILVGREVVDFAQHSSMAGSAVAHLAGAAWGFAYFRYFPRWATVKTTGPGSWMVKLKRKRKASIQTLRREDEASVRARVDALLKKISTDGIGALSEEEKTFLQEASKRFR